jgi:ureidoacrylate peracid hydrolase
MQNAFGSPGGMFDRAGVAIGSIQDAVAPTRAAVAAARQAGLKVIYLKMGFEADLSDLRTSGGAQERFFARLGILDGALTRDEWGTDIVYELTPEPGDTVLYKTRFSGFCETELDDLLRAAGITHLIVTGCTTSICVESTVRDAFFRDYTCIVLEDCTAEPIGDDLGRTNYDATLLLVERVFGSISTGTDLVEAVERETIASR